jgi:hypothetical protein
MGKGKKSEMSGGASGAFCAADDMGGGHGVSCASFTCSRAGGTEQTSSGAVVVVAVYLSDAVNSGWDPIPSFLLFHTSEYPELSIPPSSITSISLGAVVHDVLLLRPLSALAIFFFWYHYDCF